MDSETPIEAQTKPTLIANLRKALRRPGRIVPYLRWRVNCRRVAEVTVDGETFYRYKGDLYPAYLNDGNACAFIREKALEHCRGRGLDIGAGPWPLPGAIPIREGEEQDAYNLDQYPDGSLDYVFSSHCVEHLERWQEALRLWIRKLKPGGVLFLYLPHESMKLWNPHAAWVGRRHVWRPTVARLLPFLRDEGVEITEHNPDRDDYWSFHVVARRAS